MSSVTKLHEAVRGGDLDGMRKLLEANPSLASSRSETDARGTYPLHVAAEFGQADAARVLLEYGTASRPSAVRWAGRKADGSSSRMPPWKSGEWPRT